MESFRNVIKDTISKHNLEPLSESVGEQVLNQIDRSLGGKKPSREEAQKAIDDFVSKNLRPSYRKMREDRHIQKEIVNRLTH